MARALAELQARFLAVPINRQLGLRLVAAGDGRAEVTMPAGVELAQETGIVHGGMVTTLADTTAVYALVPDLGEGETVTGVEFKLNFLRAARIGGGDLCGTSVTLRRGRRISVCEAEIHQSGRWIAKGSFTFLHLPPES